MSWEPLLPRQPSEAGRLPDRDDMDGAGSRIGALVMGAVPSVTGTGALEASGHHSERRSPDFGDLRCGTSWRISTKSRPSASISAQEAVQCRPVQQPGEHAEVELHS